MPETAPICYARCRTRLFEDVSLEPTYTVSDYQPILEDNPLLSKPRRAHVRVKDRLIQNAPDAFDG